MQEPYIKAGENSCWLEVHKTIFSILISPQSNFSKDRTTYFFLLLSMCTGKSRIQYGLVAMSSTTVPSSGTVATEGSANMRNSRCCATVGVDITDALVSPSPVSSVATTRLARRSSNRGLHNTL
jgi:hypothetical protein